MENVDVYDTTTGADLNKLIVAITRELGNIDVEMASPWDMTTGSNLNSLIKAFKTDIGEIDVDYAEDTDTTTGENLNSLIAAIKKFRGEIDAIMRKKNKNFHMRLCNICELKNIYMTNSFFRVSIRQRIEGCKHIF